ASHFPERGRAGPGRAGQPLPRPGAAGFGANRPATDRADQSRTIRNRSAPRRWRTARGINMKRSTKLWMLTAVIMMCGTAFAQTEVSSGFYRLDFVTKELDDTK